jgi:uncharacterized membrane protein YoaK (UPF0700 family)
MSALRRRHIIYFVMVLAFSLAATLGMSVIPIPWIIFVTGLPVYLGYSLFGWFDAREAHFLFFLICFVMTFLCMSLVTLPTLAALHYRRRENPFWLMVQLAALILYYWATFEIVFKNV